MLDYIKDIGFHYSTIGAITISISDMPKCGGDIHTPKEILDRILEEVGIREPLV